MNNYGVGSLSGINFCCNDHIEYNDACFTLRIEPMKEVLVMSSKYNMSVMDIFSGREALGCILCSTPNFSIFVVWSNKCRMILIMQFVIVFLMPA